MFLHDDIKLDYSDVLIVPQASKVSSRKEVDLEVGATFNCGRSWKGVPIMASNMSTIGTHAMAKALYQHKMMTCLRKGGLYYENLIRADARD
jgi:GMP reductase